MTASPSVRLVEELDVDPPLYLEAHKAITQRWRREKYICPELTSWLVVAALDELSDADRAVIALDAENAVLNGFAS